jgi:cysteine-S-conjugate beta-lyase
MDYNFDEILTRNRSGSVKWDLAPALFGNPDILPLWVADMDFRVAPEIEQAIINRAADGVYGYTFCTETYYEAIISWFAREHEWHIKREWITVTPGVVSGLSILLQALAKPGDRVLVQPPVYYHFFELLELNGIPVEPSYLVPHNDTYAMDFDDLEKKASDPRVKFMILCSPHNPVGQIWTRDELMKVCEICIANDVTIISDEIHCDLILPGNRFTPTGTLDESVLPHLVVCTSPSKTFNLAGLQTANLIIPDPVKRKALQDTLHRAGLTGPGTFGPPALEAAYRHGKLWLSALLQYLEGNFEFLDNYLKTRIPEVTMTKPRATYLAWLDFRHCGCDEKALRELLIKKAGVALNPGSTFGSPRDNLCARMNIACPRSYLEKALHRIEEAVRNRER